MSKKPKEDVPEATTSGGLPTDFFDDGQDSLEFACFIILLTIVQDSNSLAESSSRGKGEA